MAIKNIFKKFGLFTKSGSGRLIDEPPLEDLSRGLISFDFGKGFLSLGKIDPSCSLDIYAAEPLADGTQLNISGQSDSAFKKITIDNLKSDAQLIIGDNAYYQMSGGPALGWRIYGSNGEPIWINGICTPTQIISTMYAGTSPFRITSPTLNTNLNSDMTDGYHLNQNVLVDSDVTHRKLILTGKYSPPTTESYENFEDVSEWNRTTGDITCDTTHVHSGTYAGKLTIGADQCLVWKDIGTATTPSRISTWFYCASGHSNADLVYYISKAGGSITDRFASFYMRSNSPFHIDDDTGNICTYTQNQWNHLELKNINWSARTYDVYLNDVFKVTRDMTGSAVDFGFFRLDDYQNNFAWIDDFEYDIGTNETKYLNLADTQTPTNAFGNKGDICFDADNIYVCVADNTWKKAALAAI